MILKKGSNNESEMSTSELSPGDDYDDFYSPSTMLANTSKPCQYIIEQPDHWVSIKRQ